MKKSRKTNPMIVELIKGDVHVQLILWPVMQVRLEVDDDVSRYEIHPARIAEPFRAVSEVCYKHHAELKASGKDISSLHLLKELEAITGMGRNFPIHELKAAGWTVPDFRRMEAV